MSAPGTRKVLVTGGGSGIGKAIAEALLARGGQVAVAGRRSEKLEEIVASSNGRAVALPCDLANPEEQRTLVQRAFDALGGLDGLVHSAGEVRHEPLGQIPEPSLRSQLEINLVAPLRLGEAALELLEEGGAVLFVSSTLAVRPVPTSAVYSAAKAGVLALMKSLALAGAARRIRVNAILPGVVDTEMIRTPRPRAGGSIQPVDEVLEDLRALHPLGRLGVPNEIAEAAVHLLSAPWTTGAELVVDGGLLLRE